MDIHQPKLLMEAYYGVYASNDNTSEDLYEQVADFLISEGYAEDFEDAIDLIEELDDEEIEGILDEVTGRGKVDPMYGTHNRNSESTRQQAGGRAMQRTPYQKMQDKYNRTKALNPTPENKRRVRKIGTAMRNATADLAGQQVQAISARKKERERFQNEELDVYDLVLDHLLDEGYADSEQDALQIMSNMSEEWVDEIIDEASEIMTVTSPKGEKRKVNRQNRRHPLAQTARKLLALQKRQALNPRAMGSRSARNQAANEFETNAKKSIYRLNDDPRVEYDTADRETHLANVRRKARARKGRD